MIGLIKGLFYMIFVLIIMQGFNFLYNFIMFYFKNKKKNENNFDSNISLNMLQCEKCKIYISKSEAYILNGKIYCKKDHSN
ncbi:MAG TPA: PP0621 family protein [Candidatus Azoamicus sp.]